MFQNEPMVTKINRANLIINSTGTGDQSKRGCMIGQLQFHCGQEVRDAYYRIRTERVINCIASFNNFGLDPVRGMTYGVSGEELPRSREEMEFMLRDLLAGEGIILQFEGAYSENVEWGFEEEVVLVTA